MASRGDKDSARKVLDFGYKMLNPTSVPYGVTSEDNRHDYVSLQYAVAYCLAGDSVKGLKIADEVIRDCRQQVDYYNSLSDNEAPQFQQDLQTAKYLITQLEGLKSHFSAKPAGATETPQIIK